MTEEIFWEHHKALPIDHYTLLERVSDPRGYNGFVRGNA